MGAVLATGRQTLRANQPDGVRTELVGGTVERGPPWHPLRLPYAVGVLAGTSLLLALGLSLANGLGKELARLPLRRLGTGLGLGGGALALAD